MSLYGLVDRLSNAEPPLQTLALAMGDDEDVFVCQVDRTVEEEQADIDKGVAWLSDPMDSEHVVDPLTRPRARAVDLAPYDLATKTIPWKDDARFNAFGARVKAKAAELQIAITWGGDWTHHRDADHFELVGLHGGQAV